MGQPSPSEIKTELLDETLSAQMPSSKKMKPNITVEQDSNGVANKFISYNADCHGTVVVNGNTEMNPGLRYNNNNQNVSNYFPQNLIGAEHTQNLMNMWMLQNFSAAQSQNYSVMNQNNIQQRNTSEDTEVNRMKRNHSSGMGSVISGTGVA